MEEAKTPERPQNNGQQIIYQEGSPWFWKIFGGAILGMVSLLLFTHINYITTNIDRVRQDCETILLDVKNELRTMRTTLDDYRDRIKELELQRLKIESIEKNLSEQNQQINSKAEKVASVEATVGAMQEKIKTLETENKELTKQIQEIREKLAVQSESKPAVKP